MRFLGLSVFALGAAVVVAAVAALHWIDEEQIARDMQARGCVKAPPDGWTDAWSCPGLKVVRPPLGMT